MSTRAARGTHLALVVLLLGALTALAGPPPAAQATAASPSPAQAGLATPQFVRLRITSQTPPAVSATGTTTVTVTGDLVNVGDRDVRDLEVRLQRAPALASEADLRATLRTVPDAADAATDFVPASPLLAPGASAPFTATAQLTGTGPDGLGVTAPGTYPLVVNVNGVPDFGNRAKLDQAEFLLPVLGLPAAGATPAVSPATTTPVGTTVLWPLADLPRIEPTTGNRVTLTDDDLATSFAPGGRLDALLSAVETRTAAAADPTGNLGRSLCLAVDPDLVVTAKVMVSGYQVPDGAGGERAGTGGQAASAWLDRLRGVAQRTCVQAIPWARADLDALTRAGLDGLRATAVGSAEQVVSGAVGRPVTAGTTWPTSGAVDPTTASALAAAGQRTALLSRDAVRTADGETPDVGTSSVGLTTGLSGLLIDPPVSTALARTGSRPSAATDLDDSPAQGSESGEDAEKASTRGTDENRRVLALQDAIGALSFAPLAAATGGQDGGGPDDAVPSRVLVAPPQYWTIDGVEPGAVLDGLLRLYQAGLATAAPLPDAVDAARAAAAAPGGSTATPYYPVSASRSEVGRTATTGAATVEAGIDRFVAAATVDPQLGVTPTQLVDPLRLGLLRALRTGSGAAAGPEVAVVSTATENTTSQVSLVTPGGSFTLASKSSPLLLTVRNQLPVAVTVQVDLSGPPGIVTTDVGSTLVPALSNVPLQVPTSVARSGQFAVDATLVTATGQGLGTSTRLLVRSTAYGAATAAVVAGLALVLLALVARRLWHRLRGQPDRADEGR